MNEAIKESGEEKTDVSLAPADETEKNVKLEERKLTTIASTPTPPSGIEKLLSLVSDNIHDSRKRKKLFVWTGIIILAIIVLYISVPRFVAFLNYGSVRIGSHILKIDPKAYYYDDAADSRHRLKITPDSATITDLRTGKRTIDNNKLSYTFFLFIDEEASEEAKNNIDIIKNEKKTELQKGFREMFRQSLASSGLRGDAGKYFTFNDLSEYSSHGLDCIVANFDVNATYTNEIKFFKYLFCPVDNGLADMMIFSYRGAITDDIVKEGISLISTARHAPMKE